MSFQSQLAALGFKTYKDYLAGPHWHRFRLSYRSSGLSQRCAVCGSVRYDLHHTTYVRLGRERLSDVLPLCRTHHVAVHEWLRKKRLAVEQSYMAVEDLRGTTIPSFPQKQVRRLRAECRTLRRQIRSAIEKVGKGDRNFWARVQWLCQRLEVDALKKLLASLITI